MIEMEPQSPGREFSKIRPIFVMGDDLARIEGILKSEGRQSWTIRATIPLLISPKSRFLSF